MSHFVTIQTQIRDIAINRDAESEPYTLTTDWWNGHVEKEVGPKYGRLLQLYGAHKTIREAHRKRLRVSHSEDKSEHQRCSER